MLIRILDAIHLHDMLNFVTEHIIWIEIGFFFSDLFFLFSWLTDRFCDAEVMRNMEKNWNGLRAKTQPSWNFPFEVFKMSNNCRWQVPCKWWLSLLWNKNIGCNICRSYLILDYNLDLWKLFIFGNHKIFPKWSKDDENGKGASNILFQL